MRLIQLGKVYARLLGTHGKPSEVPHSLTLCIFLALIFCILDILTNVWYVNIVNIYDQSLGMRLSFGGAAIVALVWVLVLVASVRTLFAYYKHTERVLQIVTSILGVDIFLTLVTLLWMLGLTLMRLPLDYGTTASIVLIIGFVLIMYWQFMVYVHILMNSLHIKLMRAGTFALIYLIVQHNLTELLINIVINISEPVA